MRGHFAAIAALVACVLGGAALAVSLLHGGPRGMPGAVGPQGPQGPQGSAGSSATQSRLGVCWAAQTFTQNFSDGTSDTWVSGVQIDQAVYANGVFTCPQGETFTSIVPATAPTLGG